ncbi:methyltransferase domain-containing protein [Marinobacter nanhaiticus D15-8W]|uniref:Class I SAM-dependent methyltransferase n=1 Tax=Marinobacter nanhaiticus D15-8W TaxID=626887 RepID=N6VVJ3_9GAMM|nr:class I SAM-dependent methyltransferase [Marinobacter nanhaiticus]ENO14195.1 class I SAM-dependent methyltransferase [Marinobacter nanhaiticus D15-8W]BES71582.1 methyltransferase domain-containing protein [Marinobacter nanhaiticus D15-8W]
MVRAGKRNYTLQRDAFEAWFQSPLGRALLADQREQIDALLGDQAGAHQLLVSVSHRLPLATSTDFSMRMMTTPRWSSHLPDGVVVCEADELPFPNESVDLVIMHHTHDFSERPHQVVREAARVLRSSGSLVIIGFNPFSSWGLRKLVSRRQHPPWSGRFVTLRRLEDWLSLLEFEVEETTSRFFRPPIRGQHALDRLNSLEKFGRRLHLPAGAYYCIRAEKRVLARTANRIRWRKPKPVALPVAGALGSSSAARHASDVALPDSRK